MRRVRFSALEYLPDATLAPADYHFHGSPDLGWTVERNGRLHLSLPSGYTLLRSAACGVCSTDLARRYLPFPLPQIIGHEVTAIDEDGRRCAIEINASHRSRGADECAFCRAGLDTHCPDRLVLGIHDLPGGFGPYVLAPVHAVLPIPHEISPRCDVLIEPLAAAFHAVHKIAPRDGDRVAVLGPRKLGMLTIAALAAYRRQYSRAFTIIAWARRPELLQLAEALGADEVRHVDEAHLRRESADVVIDTTGSPDGLLLALQLARREVHLKSTHGRPAAGLTKLTALVVDEIGLRRFPGSAAENNEAKVAWLSRSDPPAWLESSGARVMKGADAATILRQLEREGGDDLRRADAAVADTAGQVDEVIRPAADREVSLVRPRGTIYVTTSPDAGDASPLMRAIVERHVRLTSSRCGSFRPAIACLQSDPVLRTACERLITHTFPASELAQALRIAASTACVKAVVEHGDVA